MEKQTSNIDYGKIIRKAHVRALGRFIQELDEWRKETGEEVATLYEDPFTSFTLKDVCIIDGRLCYTQDGTEYSERCVEKDPDDGKYYEIEYDGIMDYVKFWRQCLRRARRYWQMDVDELDRIQNGEADDNEEEEESLMG